MRLPMQGMPSASRKARSVSAFTDRGSSRVLGSPRQRLGRLRHDDVAPAHSLKDARGRGMGDELIRLPHSLLGLPRSQITL